MNFHELSKIKKEISLILENDAFNNYSTKLFAQEYNITNELMIEHLKRLEKFGLVKNVDNFSSFQLTERAAYIKIGLERERLDNSDDNLNRNLDMFHILLILNYNN
jgi:DNA-binding Lrp family transcriptional regulator